jgi:long-chain acyl-CoA synthetase
MGSVSPIRRDRAVSAETVPAMFLRRVEETPERTAFLVPEESGWRPLTWRQVEARVRAIAGGLLSLGLAREERCAILCSTRIEWILADLGVLCAGGATTTIYPASTPEECAYILRDCEAGFLFVEDAELLAKVERHRAELPALKTVIVLSGSPGAAGWSISLADLESRGRDFDEAHPEAFADARQGVRSDSLATLIYTSGTTGLPKGVELTHDCWVYEAAAIEALEMIGPTDLHYLWLPLAHVFGKVLEVAQLRIGFTTAVDGRLEKLTENLRTVRPTLVCGVPRVFEKIYDRVLSQARAAPSWKRRLFFWSLEIGRRLAHCRRTGRQLGVSLAVRHAVADALVLRKVRRIFGGRLRFFISGSAPLAADLAEFFHAFGVLILEGYGLTESSAASFVNRPQDYRFGTVGRAVSGMQVRVAADGEILLRGRGIMRRYHNLPGATADALDEEGWLSTGDIGEIDSDGFVKITDRKKDLIKTSTGKYVAPQAVEQGLALRCPYIGQVLVHGNNKSYCAALITLNEAEVRSWARQAGREQTSLAELVRDRQLNELIRSAVREWNAHLSRHEMIRKFALLPSEFSVESGELTPNFKLKRRAIEARYAPLLASLYPGRAASLETSVLGGYSRSA